MPDITINIPSENVAELTLGYTKIRPVPNGMNYLQWAKLCIINDIKNIYERGKKEIAKEGAEVIDLGIT